MVRVVDGTIYVASGKQNVQAIERPTRGPARKNPVPHETDRETEGRRRQSSRALEQRTCRVFSPSGSGKAIFLA